MAQQLPLNVRLRANATFENFYNPSNEQLLAALHDPCETFIFIWGSVGSGKTHLLQAVCHAIAESRTSAYVPLGMAGLAPSMLEGLEQLDVVCVDDVQMVAKEPSWETAFFHFYNRIRDAGHRLIVTADVSPVRLTIGLPDLLTRLSWGSVYQLQSLDDSGKRHALQQRAREQGIELSDEVVSYLLRRYSRNPGSLFELLDRLDEASLVAQKRLTVPFVSRFLDQLV